MVLRRERFNVSSVVPVRFSERQRGGIYDIKSTRGTAHREQSEPRQEREFLDRRPRVEIAALPGTETGIRLRGDAKPHQ
jgi:hypothetical protein